MIHRPLSRIVVLAGGVGGSRFVRGVAPLAAPGRTTVIINTGDDDQFHGLQVSPDADTILYVLAGLADTRRGWGRRGESFRTLGALRTLGNQTWFQLGDLDLATHIDRTARRLAGEPLSAIIATHARALGISTRLLPMTDAPVRTRIRTARGELAFQEWLVRERARPKVLSIRYVGCRKADPAPGVLDAIAAADVILLAPSNPFVSLGPILAVRGVRRALRAARAPIVAISPLIGGRSVRGPADRMMRALGVPCGPAGLAALFSDLLDGIVVDDCDLASARRGLPANVAITATNLLMTSPARSREVADVALQLAHSLARPEGDRP